MDEPKIFGSPDEGNASAENTSSPQGHAKGVTWAWFSANMATGSLAVVLFQTPYKFQGLVTLGKVIFILDLISFVLFVALLMKRFLARPKTLAKSLHDPQESFYFGTFWVSVALILENISIYGSPSCGPWLQKALEVLFWCYFACVVFVAIVHYQTLFVSRNLPLSAMTPSWILPIYPLLITGPLAATLLHHQPSWASSRIWVAGVLGQGLGWMVTTFMYVLWTIRLLHNKLPDPAQRPGMYIAVGPTGQSSGSSRIYTPSKLRYRLHCASATYPGQYRIKGFASPLLRGNYKYCSGYDSCDGCCFWHIPLAFGFLVLWSYYTVYPPRLQENDLQP